MTSYQPDTFAPARVYIHAGDGRRLAELPSAVAKRAYRTMTVSQATAVLSENDPALSLCNPVEGRFLVIESSLYPLVWAGPLRNVEWEPGLGTATLLARSYESVLQERYLPTDFVGSGTSGGQFEALWRAVEAENPTGVSLSQDLGAGEPFDDTSYADRSLFDSWNLCAQQTGHEWWLEHAVSQGVLTTVAQFRPQRGQDRSQDCRLMVGPHASIRANRARISVDGSGHRIRAIAGATSATTAFTERSRVERRAGKAPISIATLVTRANTRHGYSFGKWPTGDTVLTRGEQLAILENVRGAGALAIAAEAVLAKGQAAQQAVDLEVQAHPDLWRYCTPGDVVWLTLPEPYFFSGYDGPVAILDVDLFEEGGTLRLNVEVPGVA